MLNLGRNDRWVDLKESNKPEAKPTSTNAVAKPATAVPNVTSTVRPAPAPALTPESASSVAPARAPAPADAQPARELAPQPSPEEVAGSKLLVGFNIKLKGVEISN